VVARHPASFRLCEARAVDQRQGQSSNARAASLSGEPVPVDLLTIRAPSPDWFRWAISHPSQSQFVVVAGCRIHYLDWARGPAKPGERGLLFVHGGGAQSHWWSYIAPYFTRDFRVAAIDLSGMGDSGWRAHYTSELRAEEIRAVIGAAQLGERPFVIGHSFGGFMTMNEPLRHRQTKGAETDMPGLPPPRHFPTLPKPVLRPARELQCS
jgi:pimeloyl-ACP methyl ester carboxylesterase